MKRLFKWILWILQLCPYVEYEGEHCGICGNWYNKKVRIPRYKSIDQWHDTWGICNKCRVDKPKLVVTAIVCTNDSTMITLK